MGGFKFQTRPVDNWLGPIRAGHGRYAAAVLLGLQEVPVIRVEGLSEAKRRALALADNKIGENAGWDRELLATELPELADILIVEGLDLSITGFAPVEIDQIATDFEEDSSDPADTVDPEWTKCRPLSSMWRSLAIGPSPAVVRRRPQARQRLPRHHALRPVQSPVSGYPDQLGQGHRTGVRHHARRQPAVDLGRWHPHRPRRQPHHHRRSAQAPGCLFGSSSRNHQAVVLEHAAQPPG